MFKSINPATGVQIAAYPELSKEEVDAKLEKAVSAFQFWRQTDVQERADLLGRNRRLL